jgi:hypothetical protein
MVQVAKNFSVNSVQRTEGGSAWYTVVPPGKCLKKISRT